MIAGVQRRDLTRPASRIEQAPGPPSGWALAPTAIGCGVAAGFLELVVFLVQTRLLHRVDSTSLHISRHVMWMIPVAEAFVVTAVAVTLVAPVLVAARLRKRGPSRTYSWMGLVLGTFLVLGPLMAIRGMAWWAACLLALGLGWRTRPFLARAFTSWGRGVRVLGLIALAFLAAHAVWFWRQAEGAANRAWAGRAPAAGSPNLLFIVLDTVRADRMSLYGYPRPTTPALERWAARGVTFEGARSPATWTLPSHVSMFTGRTPGEHGARVDRAYAGPWPTLAEHLAENGRSTAGFVANFGMCNACYGVGRGFDTYVDFTFNQDVTPFLVLYNSSLGRAALTLLDKLGSPIDWRPLYPHHPSARTIDDRAMRWLGELKAKEGRPFFLFLNYMDAHSPYLPRADMERRFSGDRPALSRREAMPATAWKALQAVSEAPVDEKAEKERSYEATRRLLGDLYDDCLLGLDAEIGRFLDALEKEGTLADTWVVITSDHGEYLGERGLFGHGIGVHDAGIHVPLMIVPPLGSVVHERLCGRRVKEAVSLCDLPTTLAARLLPGRPHPFPGEDLGRFWSETARGEADVVVCEMHTQTMGGDDVKADLVRTNSATFLEDFVLIEPLSGPAELYDWKHDPKQERNLIDGIEGEEWAQWIREARATFNARRGPTSRAGSRAESPGPRP